MEKIFPGRETNFEVDPCTHASEGVNGRVYGDQFGGTWWGALCNVLGCGADA